MAKKPEFGKDYLIAPTPKATEVERKISRIRKGDKFYTFRHPADWSEDRINDEANFHAQAHHRAQKEFDEENKYDRDPGVVPGRPYVRDFMHSLNPAVRLGVEMAPSMAGGAGALYAFPAGGPLSISVGSGIGESIGQEIGLIPKNKWGVYASFAAPLILRGVTRLPAWLAMGIRKGPGFRKAIFRRVQQLYAKEGANIHKLFGGGNPHKLWAKFDAFKSGVDFRDHLQGTTKTLNEVFGKALQKADIFPEGKETAGFARSLIDKITQKTSRVEKGSAWQTVLNPITGKPRGGIQYKDVLNPPLSIQELVSNIQSLGRVVARLEGVGGLSEGSMKLIYKSFMDDLAMLPAGSMSGKVVSIYNAAKAASKKQFALDTFRNTVEGAFSAVRSEGAEIAFNPGKVLDKFRALTNPDHALYDKNFHSSIGTSRAFERSMEWLEKANTYVSKSTGAGELVFMGKAAAFGAAAADILGMPAFLGVLAGVQLPGMLTNVLLKKGGVRHILDPLIKAGTKKMSMNKINAFAQTGRKVFTDFDKSNEVVGNVFLGLHEMYPLGQSIFSHFSPYKTLDDQKEWARLKAPPGGYDPIDLTKAEGMDVPPPPAIPLEPSPVEPLAPTGPGLMAAPAAGPGLTAPAAPPAPPPAAGGGLAAAPGPTPRTLIPTRTKELADYLKDKSYDPMAMP